MLRRAGRDDEAAAVVAAAVALYVRKGDVVSAARWREDERLEESQCMKRSATVRLLGDGKVRRRGRSPWTTGFELKRLNFMLSQKDVMVEGEGDPVDGGTWQGETDGTSLKAGEYVYAVGVAVLVHDAWPPVVQTFTWCEQVELTGP